MSYIKKRADKFAEYHLDSRIGDANELLRKIRSEVYDINNESDKVIFISTMLEANQIQLENHQVDCKKDCAVSEEHEMITYFLNQDLLELGISQATDSFTTYEKQEVDDILVQLKRDLKDIKDGQEVIFGEIDELKNWYIIGKKNWKQLASAKLGEMSAAGVVGEAISKPLLEYCSTLPALIGG